MKKKSVLFLSKALSWSFSILKTLILIGFLLFIPSLGGYVFCSPFFYRLSSFSGCLKTYEKKIFFSLSSLKQPRDFTSYPKLLLCFLKPRPLHLVSQLCPQSSCSCLRLCLLCFRHSSSNLCWSAWSSLFFWLNYPISRPAYLSTSWSCSSLS